MNPQAFQTLEFDSLRALVAGNAQTDLGRQRLKEIAPLDDFDRLQSDLERLSEMIGLRSRAVRFSFSGIVNSTDKLSRLRIAGTALEPLAILDLARVIDGALEARAIIHEHRNIGASLFEIVRTLPIELKKLSASLTRKILPNGELDDRASPQLAAIRRELTVARSRITRTLENLMRRSSEAIQEELVTVRNDRFVIPVRADHQSRIKGVAHGSSSSGATVFIEPLETIEANNELHMLRETEQREIAEILFTLSEELRRNLPAIELATEAITELDFINGKAAFADDFDCVVPVVTVPAAVATASASPTELTPDAVAKTAATFTLEFIGARHPLLQENLRASGATVVPVSLKLDQDQSAMIISGANAGGKTVVLKTVGLLAIMALCGVPVPAKGARVPFYRSILADIGDHQSLAANLSTFTSHTANIATMIEVCESPALVLVDEVGTGTDPEEGSALGVAVVDRFKQQGAHVMATTHYSGLKMYAATEPGVLNASVEFDEKTLRPTYRLLVGLAGSSSGLDIARRFGIPDEIIAHARMHVRRSSSAAVDYLRRIKKEADEAEQLRIALEEERAAVAQQFASLEAEFRQRESARKLEFEKQLSAAISEFKKVSGELLSKIEDRAARVKVEREAERRSAELKHEAQRAAKAFSEGAAIRARNQKLKSDAAVPAQLRGVRVIRDGEVVSDLRNDAPGDLRHQADAELEPHIAAEHPARALRKGDRVRLRTLGSTGIVDRIKDEEAEVRVGSLHVREKLANLELVRDKAAANRSPQTKSGSLEELRKPSTTELHLAKSSQPKSSAELNLIGRTTDDAGNVIDKFLDEAFLSGFREVRIIHGQGTGVLRKAVAELLNDHPHVARFAPAPQDQGGTGATIVELKE